MTHAPTSSTSACDLSYTARAQRHKDGSVLLSIADDRICKLNGVGALTWMILQENPAGLGVDEVVRLLSGQFAAINREGTIRYEVSPDQLHTDTAYFLKKICEMNLLRIRTDPRGQEFFQISNGVSSTTSSTNEEECLGSVSTPVAQSTGNVQVSKRETLIAFIALLSFDLLLRFRGFQSLITKVEHWPTAKPVTTDLILCKRVRAMVDRAQMYYPKKAMCLQHSAVVTCLLRRRGVPAAMILAAQEFPPKAHAWVEVAGRVVNDLTAVQKIYRVMRRI